MITTLTRPKMIPLLRMETLKNYTLLGGTYLSQWPIQTFRCKGGGAQSSRPFDKGGLVSKFFFSDLRASGWSKDKGEGGRGEGGSPGSTSVSSPYMGVPRDLNVRPPAL